MLSYGLLVRANEFELNKMKTSGQVDEKKSEILTRAAESAEVELKKLSEYLEEQIHYEVVPIQKLIRIQLEAGLIVADHLIQK
jgi:predicted solute-binding protein